MNITIDTEVLQSKDISLGEFLVLLMSFNDISYTKCLSSLVNKGIVQSDVFNPLSAVLSNKTKDLISFLLMLSNSKVQNSHIDFLMLAQKLQSIYPAHKKPGTTYDWRGKTFDIAQKLMTLVAKYSFTFTEEEAIAATQEYVDSFDLDTDPNRTKMQLLKYFILKTYSADREINSQFMTIIENNRTL